MRRLFIASLLSGTGGVASQASQPSSAAMMFRPSMATFIRAIVPPADSDSERHFPAQMNDNWLESSGHGIRGAQGRRQGASAKARAP